LTNPMLEKAWLVCVDSLKDAVNNRSFWEAVEATSAVTVEGDLLVVGLPSEDYNRASHITHSTTLNTVESVVSSVFGQPLKVKVIEGITLADWDAHKEREAKVAALRQASLVPRPASQSGSSNSWEALYEQMSRLFSQTPNRTLPTGKARFANEALYILLDAMNRLYPNPPDEASERSLCRVLERISNTSEIPAPVLAFELERLRAWSAMPAEGELPQE
jgi:DNA polymerase elongation subunit (family B)